MSVGSCSDAACTPSPDWQAVSPGSPERRSLLAALLLSACALERAGRLATARAGLAAGLAATARRQPSAAGCATPGSLREVAGSASCAGSATASRSSWGLELRWPASLWPTCCGAELQLDALSSRPPVPARRQPGQSRAPISACRLLPWLKSIRLPLRVTRHRDRRPAGHRAGSAVLPRTAPDPTPARGTKLQLHQLRWADATTA